MNVTNRIALSWIHVYEHNEGTPVWVDDVQRTYVLLKNSGAVANGNDIIAPASGAPIAGFPDARWVLEGDALPASLTLPTVIMFNGQSNMAASPAVAFGYSELTTLLGPDILGFGQNAQAMVPVVDGTANAQANQGGSGTGPGPGLGQVGTRLARYIANETGQTVYTYALAYSGQGISYFSPTSLTKARFENNSQDATYNNYDLLKSYVTKTGLVPQLYVWIQGEADAGSSPDQYYAQLSDLWTHLQADYPGINMLIVGTIQASPYTPDDRGGVAGGTVAGVRTAQKRLAEENPTRIKYVDTTDMRGYTAWWYNNHYSTFGTTYAGYEEVYLRIVAKLLGEADRPAVVAAQHPQQVYAFDHAWGQRRSIGVGGALALWSDDIGTDSLGVGGGSPDHVPSSPYFGNRTVINFDPATSDWMTEANIAGGNQWVFNCVIRPLKSSFNGTPRCVVQVEPAALGARTAFIFSASGQHQIFLEAQSYTFPGIASCEGDIAHDYLMTYDGTAGVARLYIDGVFMSELTGLPDKTTGATARIRVGTLSGSGLFFAGEMAMILVKAMPGAMPTDAEVLAMHAGSKVEYQLVT